MSLSLFLARRIYRGDDAGRQVSRPAVLIAMTGIAIGLAVMIITVSVIVGFKSEVREKIIGFGSHIQVTNLEQARSYETFPVVADDSLLAILSDYPEVSHVQRYSTKMGMVKTAEAFQGMLLKGIGPEYDLSFFRNHLLEGEFPQFSDSASSNRVVISKSLADKLKLKLGDKIGDDEIIGFMPDVKFASFRQAVSPMAFFLWGKYQRWSSSNKYYGQLYVKFKAGSDLRAGMEHVRQSLAKFDAEYPFNVRFFDEVLQQTYEQELKMGYLITLFSIVAILISIVGVFGLVVFESGYRRKEIAIRKVFGSTTGEILLMFNRGYLYILLICFALGAPVAWYGVSRWLENFAYRTPMYGWVLAVAFLVVALITVATVTFQSWRVANENPAENVKSE